MKKLFYRLSSSPCFTRLFAVLPVAIMASAIATEAQAQWGTGFSFWPGSEIKAVIKLGDYGPNIDDLVTSSVCGDGFVDTQARTLEGQTTDCTVDGKPALCTFNSLTCSCFKVGTCKGGTRTDTMTCPTNNPTTGLNEAGCTGTISVTDLNGTPIHSEIQIGGSTLANLNTNSACGAVFPNDSGSGLKKFVMGTLTQECAANSDPTTDFVLEAKVRSTTVTTPATPTASFFSTTQWFDNFDATCNPNNGFPTGACTNDGGAWITFPLATGDTCQASNFTCGQRDGPNGPISGPQPSTCTVDKSTGQCQCRCSRCTPEGTLVNLGTPGQGLFVLASDADNAYACPVTVTGN